MRVCPLSKIYLEQSTITEFISHLSSPAPHPQPITPPGVLPTQAPPACCCSRSSRPNGEGSPTARPSAEKRNREKMWRSIALTSSAPPPPRLGLQHRAHDAIDFIEGGGTAVTPIALHENVIGDLNRRMLTRCR